jgi:GT2 family glycosyltransferase
MVLDVSVIIVNWNAVEFLRDCLSSILEAADDLGLEVLVVDNASTDGSVALVNEEFPWVRLIANQENVGFARAVNLGLKMAEGEHLLILNPDVVLGPKSIAKMSHFLEARGDAGGVSPRLVDSGGALQTLFYPRWQSLPKVALFYTRLSTLSYQSRYLRAWFNEKSLPDSSHGYAEVEQLPGACFMTTKSVLARVGPMDERFFMWFEDVDWSYRAKQAGYRLYYLPTATVVHTGGYSLRQWDRSRIRRQFVLGLYLYFQKHRGRRVANLVRLIMGVDALVEIPYHVIKLLFRPTTANIQSIQQELALVSFILRLARIAGHEMIGRDPRQPPGPDCTDR